MKRNNIKGSGAEIVAESLSGQVPDQSQGEVLEQAPRVPRQNASQRANCNISVSRVDRYLRHGKFGQRFSKTASVHLTSVIEYLVAEICDLSANMALQMKARRIHPRHIYLAIKRDDELDQLLSGVTISKSGTVPYINRALLPRPILGSAKQTKQTAKKGTNEQTAKRSQEKNKKTKKEENTKIPAKRPKLTTMSRNSRDQED